jgi:iron-sulfur cluster assembly accessory protein
MQLQIDKEATKELMFLPRYLRVEVKGGGCTGFTVVYAHCREYNDDDVILNDKVVIDSKSLKLLESCTLTFANTLTYSGYSMQFGAGMSSCGCGESFTVAT